MPDPAYQFNANRKVPGQRRVEPISNKNDLSLWKPSSYVHKHLSHEVQQALSGRFGGTLPIQAHVDRQRKWFSAPWRNDLQAKQYNLKAPSVDGAILCGSDSIPARFGTGNLPTCLFVNSVVTKDPQDIGMAKKSDHKHSQRLEKLVQRPFPCTEKAMIGIMSMPPMEVAKLVDGCHEFPARAKNPANDDVGKKIQAGFGENPDEGLYKRINWRYSGHGRISSVKSGCLIHLYCSRDTTISGTGSHQNVRKSTFYRTQEKNNVKARLRSAFHRGRAVNQLAKTKTQ